MTTAAHRARRCAGTALTAHPGGGAVRRGDDRDPQGIKERYEEHHKLTITDNALKAAAELAARYVSDRFLPDKAIDLVDEAASHVRIRKTAAPPSVQEGQRGLESLRREKEQAIASQHTTGG